MSSFFLVPFLNNERMELHNHAPITMLQFLWSFPWQGDIRPTFSHLRLDTEWAGSTLAIKSCHSALITSDTKAAFTLQ